MEGRKHYNRNSIVPIEVVSSLASIPSSVTHNSTNSVSHDLSDEEDDLEKRLKLPQRLKAKYLEESVLSEKKKAYLFKQISEIELVTEDYKRSHPSAKSYERAARLCSSLFQFFLFCIACCGVLALVLSVVVYDRNFQYLTETALNYTQTRFYSDDTRPLYKVLLIGDSLNNHPYELWNLGGKLQDALPQYRVQIYDRSRDSSYIAKVAEHIVEDVQVDADIAFLFWDTDVSNVDIGLTLDSEELQILQQNYINNVTYVVNVTLSSGVQHMAMAGPGLLGERDYWGIDYMTESPVFDSKNSMLDHYEQLNRELASNLSITYIDFRSIFIGAIPDWWLFARYYVTVDGEHPNKYGTELMVTAYKRQIDEWLNWIDPSS